MNISEEFFADSPTQEDDRLHDDLKQMVRQHSQSFARSNQVALGPSQVGHPCARNVISGLIAGHRENTVNPQFDVLPAYIGTAAHKQLEDAVALDNHRRLEKKQPGRWLSERKVHVAEGLSGTCDLYDLETNTVIDFKGLATDTAIPTPDGWRTMGQLSVGDWVFDANGKLTCITHVTKMRQRDCYRIIFEDKTSVICDDVHEWNVLFGQDSSPRTMTAPQMMQRLRCPRGQSQIRIANAGPLHLPAADLPIEPYALGAWLGDGDKSSGRIALADLEIFDHIESAGSLLGPGRRVGTGKRCIRRRVDGMTAKLTSLNLIGNKHIPESYLRASHEQRLALLQGIMDTDGSWNSTRNRALFCNSDKALIYQVAELVSTLGWKPAVDTFTARGFGLVTTSYRVGFVPLQDNPFRLTRKAALVRNHSGARSKRRVIKSIERTLTVPTRCITVDAGAFLCTEAMIPTHNCPGTTQMTEYRKNGPSTIYRIQAHLYGKGYRNEGYPVKRVGIWFLPRSGLLSTAKLWTEAYDETLVQQHISRLYNLIMLTYDLDLENHPERLAAIPITPYQCTWCSYFSVNPQRTKDNPFACAGGEQYQPPITNHSGSKQV